VSDQEAEDYPLDVEHILAARERLGAIDCDPDLISAICGTAARLKWSEYYLLLRAKDRQTAILKLTIALPKYFNVKIDPKQVKLCYMKEGGMLARTRCESVIPATIEIAADGTAIEIFPDTPVPDLKTIGVYMNLMNPFDAGMYQFNALAQAPGEVPISGYLGSWLIQIDPAVGN
jgi:hypothetical protein